MNIVLALQASEKHLPMSFAEPTPMPYAAILREFELEQQSLLEHLTWLVNAAGRLRAYVTHAMRFARDSAASFGPPVGLLEPFPTHVLTASVLGVGEVSVGHGAQGGLSDRIYGQERTLLKAPCGYCTCITR